MVKCNTFEFSKQFFVPMLSYMGSIGTQRVYIKTVRNFIKKKVQFE